MSATPPRDPEFAQKVRDSFSRQGFMHHIGAELVTVEPGFCEIRLPYREELSQHHGYFHGGVIGTLADNAAGYAGFSLTPPGTSVLTVEYKLNILTPGHGDSLIARGHAVRVGRTLAVTRADVLVVDGGEEKLCAVAQQTLFCLPEGSDGGKGKRRASLDGV